MNASDEKQVKKAGERDQLRRENEIADVKFILGTPQGRRFYWRLMGLCGVFRSSWDASARIHFNEGRRDIGLHLLGELNEANPEAYVTMMKEAKEQQ